VGLLGKAQATPRVAHENALGLIEKRSRGFSELVVMKMGRCSRRDGRGEGGSDQGQDGTADCHGILGDNGRKYGEKLLRYVCGDAVHLPLSAHRAV
jgi:hypothetical protein